MILTLTAVSLNDRPLTPALTARFDDHGGTIGRADHNTLALPDPERFISRMQAEVLASGGSFLIRNVGSANAIIVGNQALSGGQSLAVRHGDVIRVGGYVLQASCPAPDVASPDATRPSLQLHASLPPRSAAPQDAPPAPVLPPVPLQAQGVPGLSASNPFADLLGVPALPSPGPSGDPFADLFGASPPAAAGTPARPAPLPAFQPAPAGINERSAALPRQGSAATPAHRLPDDFNPFAAPSPSTAQTAAAPVDPFADLMGTAPGAGVDQAFGLSDSRKDDPLAHFLSDLGQTPNPGAARAAGSAGVSTDPLMLFGAPPPPAPPAAPAQPDDVSALYSAYAPPRVLSPPAAPARLKPVPVPVPEFAPRQAPLVAAPPPLPRAESVPASSPDTGQDEEALWASFCAGAGVSLPLPPGCGPERMQAVGMMLRTAVEGTLQLMAVRASTKHELRAAVTIIQQRNNNPLKFSPDAASGIKQLMQPPVRGFLDGPAALEEAMHDLVGHSIGTVAGMRAAIEGMLGRFDPAALEAKLSGSSMLDSLLPMNRRARLWDLYLQHHHAIREEAQEDFHNLFGRAFLAAYEQQIERLRREKQRR